jgi:hypothetical protein
MDVNQGPQVFLFLSRMLGKKLLALQAKHWAGFMICLRNLLILFQ